MDTRRHFLTSTLSLGAVAAARTYSLSQTASPGDPDAVPLASLPVVTLAGPIMSARKPFSVSGIASDSGYLMINSGTDPAAVVVDLKGRFRSFEAVIGMVDGLDSLFGKDTQYKVELDGRTIAAGAVARNGKPAFLRLNVTDGRSLRVTLANAGGIGNAVLGTKEVLVEEGTLVPNDRPALLSPPHHARLTEDMVPLKWKPFPKARAYAVQVVLKKRLGKRRAPDQRLWAFTVDGATTEYDWDMKGVPSGEYAWTVLAFDEDGRMGTFSDERTFIMVR